MSRKNIDKQNRFRNITIGFRVSPEESARIDKLVKLSGLNKQDYILERLLHENMFISVNPRTYFQIKSMLSEVHNDLIRLNSGENIPQETLVSIELIGNALSKMTVTEKSK